MNRMALLLLIWGASIPGRASDLPEVVLWPERLAGPAVPQDPPERLETAGDGLTRRFCVSRPRLFVHLPPDNVRRSGAAVIVAPGGGFARLADEHEGADVCRWLSSHGIVAFQLAYRTPTTAHAEPNLGPVMDAQTALMTVRRRAADWSVRADRVGLMGFSAGGQVSLVAAAGPRRVPGEENQPSHRPDLLLLIYPYRVFDPQTQALRADVQLDSGLPPVFIAQMADDTASLAEGSALLYAALVRQRIPAELHIYERGGHGFGMRPRAGMPGTEDWSRRAAAWLQQHDFIVSAESPQP